MNKWEKYIRRGLLITVCSTIVSSPAFAQNQEPDGKFEDHCKPTTLTIPLIMWLGETVEAYAEFAAGDPNCQLDVRALRFLEDGATFNEHGGPSHTANYTPTRSGWHEICSFYSPKGDDAWAFLRWMCTKVLVLDMRGAVRSIEEVFIQLLETFRNLADTHPELLSQVLYQRIRD